MIQDEERDSPESHIRSLLAKEWNNVEMDTGVRTKLLAVKNIFTSATGGAY